MLGALQITPLCRRHSASFRACFGLQVIYDLGTSQAVPMPFCSHSSPEQLMQHASHYPCITHGHGCSWEGVGLLGWCWDLHGWPLRGHGGCHPNLGVPKTCPLPFQGLGVLGFQLGGSCMGLHGWCTGACGRHMGVHP